MVEELLSHPRASLKVPSDFMLNEKLKSNQLGQSMIEYTVVIIFGILTITSGPMRDQVTLLMDGIRENYQGYSFAVSMSDIPDSSSHNEYFTLLDSQNVSDNLKQKLSDRTSNNLQRSPSEYQREIRNYNIAPPAIQNTIKQAVNNLKSISIP